MTRFRAIAFSLVAVACGMFATAAAAAQTTVSAERPVLRSCADQLLPAGTPGAAARSWTASSSGVLTAALLGGREPNWDLALFAGGDPIGASTAFGSRERASTWVDAGDTVVAQACRRDGRREQIPLALDLQPMAKPRPQAERISMESVSIAGADDVRRLERLGLDVTHDVSPGAVSVVAYGDAQRALLESAGFDSRTEINDLAAADRADRSAEDRAAVRSALPSGRDDYREYADYTDDLEALAQANPALVRRVEIGTSFEGRPIQGVEIAADVLRQDDGRPVYLNFGAHHAREWPSAEWPMEFAIDIVRAYNDAGDPNHAQAVDVLTEVRVVVVPIVNVDGFLASRSFGFNPLTDDDPDATLALSAGGVAAYRRKNCRPLNPAEQSTPCAMRGGSGIDLNRNYGYYWGGPGSSNSALAQNYRGTDPFSEPESEAVHQFSSTIHPTVFITNHTFTDDGKWLRQPGFDATFLPQKVLPGYEDQGCGAQSAGDLGAFTPDEDAMKALGDAMAGATGFTSELGYETLCDITGATEDWNYFGQGTYGYTPEARGTNFHPNYADGVVTEYLGDATHPGLGVREAYLIAGERAANPADHGIITGTVPPGATLKLTKDFVAPTFNQPAKNVSEHLETTLIGSADGSYEWHVNPSDRPAVSGGPVPDPVDEVWTMTCQRAGQGAVFTTPVDIARGQTVTVDWAAACGADPPGNEAPVAGFDVSPLAPLTNQQVNFISTSTDPDGAIDTTEWDLDGDGDFDDASGLVASRTFDAPGSYGISVRVTDDDGAADTEAKSVVVAVSGLKGPPPMPPTGTCRGRSATQVGSAEADVMVGTPGDDVIQTGGGNDVVRAGAGDDVVCGGLGRDRLFGGPGADDLNGNKLADRLFGGGGPDRLRGGLGADLLSGGPGADDCSGGGGRNRLRSC